MLETGLVNPRYHDQLQTKRDWPFEPDEHPKLDEMREHEVRYRSAFLDLMRERSLDALMFPTFRFPPVMNGSITGARAKLTAAPVGSNNHYASLTGFPALNLPMGFVAGELPIGLQLMGRPRSEGTTAAGRSRLRATNPTPPAASVVMIGHDYDSLLNLSRLTRRSSSAV